MRIKILQKGNKRRVAAIMVEYIPNNQIKYRIKIFSKIKLYTYKIIITIIMKERLEVMRHLQKVNSER